MTNPGIYTIYYKRNAIQNYLYANKLHAIFTKKVLIRLAHRSLGISRSAKIFNHALLMCTGLCTNTGVAAYEEAKASQVSHACRRSIPPPGPSIVYSGSCSDLIEPRFCAGLCDLPGSGVRRRSSLRGDTLAVFAPPPPGFRAAGHSTSHDAAVSQLSSFDFVYADTLVRQLNGFRSGRATFLD